MFVTVLFLLLLNKKDKGYEMDQGNCSRLICFCVCVM